MVKNKGKALILTEGSKDIGFGHITRMLALYGELENQGYKTVLHVNGDKSAETLLSGVNSEIIVWTNKKECKKILQKEAPDVVIIDSYLASKDIYAQVAGNSLLVSIDDFDRLNYPSGIILQTVKENSVSNDGGKTYLRGLQYALLRKEFIGLERKKINQSIKNIMITFGGDDIRHLTIPTVKLLESVFPGVQKKVIVAEGFDLKEKEKLDSIAALDSEVILIKNASAQQMLETMQKADIVISAAGQTLNELAATGTPVIAVGVADNQKEHFALYEKNNFTTSAGWVLDSKKDTDGYLAQLKEKVIALTNREIRKKISTIGDKLIDGKGVKRIVNYINESLGYD